MGATQSSYQRASEDLRQRISVRPHYTDSHGYIDSIPSGLLLSDMEQSQGGFAFTGRADEKLGTSITSTGDINGDGINDMMVLAPGDNVNTGELYIIYGKIGTRPSLESNQLVFTRSSEGFLFSNYPVPWHYGNKRSLAKTGDINNDGLADMLPGAPRLNQIMVLYGSQHYPSTITYPQVLGKISGWVIDGSSLPPNSEFGDIIAGGQDIDGDGIPDIVTTAKRQNQVYVIYGANSHQTQTLNDLIQQKRGFVIQGSSEQYLGDNLSIRDINHDGLADIIISEVPQDSYASDIGRIYVIYGKPRDHQVTSLASIAQGTGGFTINLNDIHGANQFADGSVTITEDINGDNISDLLIGNPSSGIDNRTSEGVTYVVYGAQQLSEINLKAIARGSGGFIIEGSIANRRSGTQLSFAGDINADNVGDILIATDGNLGYGPPEAYLVYGRVDSGNTPIANINLQNVKNGTGGFVINHKLSSKPNLSAAGDINSDHLDDLLISDDEWTDSTQETNKGRLYAIYGGNNILLPSSPNHHGYIIISSTAQTLTATLNDSDGYLPNQVTWQWNKDGKPIPSSTDSIYSLSSLDPRSYIQAHAFYTDTLGYVESVFSPVYPSSANHKGSGALAFHISPTSSAGTSITAYQGTLNDLDGLPDMDSMKWQWLKNGIEINGATQQKYILTNGDIGASIEIRVTYTDRMQYQETVQSQIMNQFPIGEARVEGTLGASQGNTLTASLGNIIDTDGLPDLSHIRWQWIQDGHTLPGETSSIYVQTSNDLGHRLQLRMLYQDLHGYTEQRDSRVLNIPAMADTVDHLPTGRPSINLDPNIQNRLETISTDPNVREFISGNGDLRDEDHPDGVQITLWQWFRNDNPIPKATQSTYHLEYDDIGTRIAVRIGYQEGTTNVTVFSAYTRLLIEGQAILP